MKGSGNLTKVKTVSYYDYEHFEYYKCKYCIYISEKEDEIHEHIINQHVSILGWQEVEDE